MMTRFHQPPASATLANFASSFAELDSENLKARVLRGATSGEHPEIISLVIARDYGLDERAAERYVRSILDYVRAVRMA